MKTKHKYNCKCKTRKRPLKDDNPWYVNSSEFDNCFWYYMEVNDRPHALKEVAKLLNLSISAIMSVEKRAFTKVKRRLSKQGLSIDDLIEKNK